MMRVGLLVYGADRPITGQTRYTLELGRALQALDGGLELVLLTAGRLPGSAGLGSALVVPLPGCRRVPGLMTLGNLELPGLARRHRLDLIHDPTGLTPFLFGSGRARLVVTVHDVFAWSIPGYSSSLDAWIYRHWLPRLLPVRARAVITVSHCSKREIGKYLHIEPEQVSVIYEGTTPGCIPLPQPDVQKLISQRYQIEFPYVLFVGSLTRRKNIEGALQAFARLSPQHPQLRFVLVGPRAWQKTPVEVTVKSLAIQDKILLTGPVPDSDLPYLYNGARMFLFPSLYEGFGLPPLEAMACGTPVVTSNASSLPEVVGDAAVLVDPYDVDAIAEAMRRILSDPTLAEDLRQRGLQRARQFTWEQTALQTLQVYQQVLAA
jgi:glycosyltransferase involved in cell wall biosynthesis